MVVPTRKLLFKRGNLPKAQAHRDIRMNRVMKLLEQVQDILGELQEILVKEKLRKKSSQSRIKSAEISELQLILERRS
jgi:hypothetical protein